MAKIRGGARRKGRISTFLQYLFYCRCVLPLFLIQKGAYAAADFVCDDMSFQRDLLPFPRDDAAYSHLRGADGSRCLWPVPACDSADAPITEGESEGSRASTRPILSKVLRPSAEPALKVSSNECDHSDACMASPDAKRIPRGAPKGARAETAQDLSTVESNKLSQSQRRKDRELRCSNRWLREGLNSLNEMSGQPSGSDATSLSAAQSTAVSRLAREYHSVGKRDCDPSPLRAFQSLLGTKSGYSGEADGSSGNVAVFRHGTVKFPSVAAGVRCLSESLPEPWRSKLTDGRSLLRDPQEVQRILNDSGNRCAMDPVLRTHKRELGRFLSDLWRRDMAEMGSATDIRVGIFFVHRKDDKLRMIVDPKITNLICRDPPYTALPGTSNLAEMECLPSQQLTFASGDVDCCYFQYRLPPAMRSLFGLPMV